MQMTAAPVRFFYEKTARAKYISHLDAMRTFTRALRRTGLPLWYTEGFNPHLYITFALPLSLGHEGLCETFDVRFTKETCLETAAALINSAMPMGFKIIRAAKPVMEPSAIAWADYEIRLIYNERDVLDVRETFASFCSLPAIEVLKKTKKGETSVDIRPHTKVLSEGWAADGVRLCLRTAAGNSLNINPTLYLKAFYEWANLLPEGVRVIRTAILTRDLEKFE